MFASTEIIGVDKILASTKYSCRQKSRVDKNLASKKILRQQKSRVNKMLAQAQKYLLAFCRRRYFVGANILSPPMLCQRQYFVAANIFVYV
jgi:hypothetical protein